MLVKNLKSGEKSKIDNHSSFATFVIKVKLNTSFHRFMIRGNLSLKTLLQRSNKAERRYQKE